MSLGNLLTRHSSNHSGFSDQGILVFPPDVNLQLTPTSESVRPGMFPGLRFVSLSQRMILLTRVLLLYFSSPSVNEWLIWPAHEILL